MSLDKSDILFEDNDIIVCHKHSGIPVQSSNFSTKDMISLIKNYIYDNNNSKGEPYLGVINRLDQPVEGIVLFAKTQQAAKFLSKELSDGNIKKQYTAVICGIPPKATDTLVDYIVKDSRSNCSKIVNKKTPNCKCARLEYTVLDTVTIDNNILSLVRINLLTGRHHQIRVQFAGLGCPLWGDKKYNSHNFTDKQCFPALCACQLNFRHPRTKKDMEFKVMPEGTIFSSL